MQPQNERDGILEGYSNSLHTPVHHTKSSKEVPILGGGGGNSVMIIFEVSRSSMRSPNAGGGPYSVCVIFKGAIRPLHDKQD